MNDTLLNIISPDFSEEEQSLIRSPGDQHYFACLLHLFCIWLIINWWTLFDRVLRICKIKYKVHKNRATYRLPLFLKIISSYLEYSLSHGMYYPLIRVPSLGVFYLTITLQCSENHYISDFWWTKRGTLHFWKMPLSHLPGSDLLSQGDSPPLPSAPKSLTAVFGMGTGVTSSLWPPDLKPDWSRAFKTGNEPFAMSSSSDP